MSDLTPREIQVLIGIAAGLRAREIAEALGVSQETIRTHRQRIRAALGVHTSAHAVAVGLREGLIE